MSDIIFGRSARVDSNSNRVSSVSIEDTETLSNSLENSFMVTGLISSLFFKMKPL